MKHFPCGSDGKESACSAGDPGLIPESGRSPGEGNGNPLQYLPGESHGQRSLAGYSPWGHKSWTRLSDYTTTTTQSLTLLTISTTSIQATAILPWTTAATSYLGSLLHFNQLYFVLLLHSSHNNNNSNFINYIIMLLYMYLYSASTTKILTLWRQGFFLLCFHSVPSTWLAWEVFVEWMNDRSMVNHLRLNEWAIWALKALFKCFLKNLSLGNSLVVLWLGLCTSTAGGMGLIPDQRTKILQARLPWWLSGKESAC